MWSSVTAKNHDSCGPLVMPMDYELNGPLALSKNHDLHGPLALPKNHVLYVVLWHCQRTTYCMWFSGTAEEPRFLWSSGTAKNHELSGPLALPKTHVLYVVLHPLGMGYSSKNVCELTSFSSLSSTSKNYGSKTYITIVVLQTPVRGRNRFCKPRLEDSLSFYSHSVWVWQTGLFTDKVLPIGPYLQKALFCKHSYCQRCVTDANFCMYRK